MCWLLCLLLSDVVCLLLNRLLWELVCVLVLLWLLRLLAMLGVLRRLRLRLGRLMSRCVIERVVDKRRVVVVLLELRIDWGVWGLTVVGSNV